MDWSKLQATLVYVFNQATRLPFIWDENPRGLLPKPFGVLSLGQSITLGRDSYSYTFRDSDISLDLYGHRELSITVQIYSRQSNGALSARSLIEKARLALANPDLREELRKVGLIFVENHPVIDLNFSFDQRHESRAAFDVVFRVLLHEQHLTKQPGYFEHIELREPGIC
jgi:hypothetical protein